MKADLSSAVGLTALQDLGAPTIDGLGPDGGRPHSTDEYVELASLPKRTETLALFLAALADPSTRRFVEA